MRSERHRRGGRGRASFHVVAAAAALSLVAALAWAREEAPSAASAAVSAAGERPALSPLPKLPSLEMPPPSNASLEALDALLARLASRDSGERETAASEVLEVERDRLPAIHRRIGSIAESSDHVAMKELLGQIRDKAHEEKKGPPPDYLEMLEAHAKPDSKTFRDLVQVVGMSRMLRHVGTTPAARELIGIYARFGEFLRVDTQLSLEKMGERAVAALIEATRHPAPKIAHWAERQLDALGKAIPGEAVRTNDPEVLADVLRAYGRTRDPDAARLVISFANSERTQIREAARQAVVLMGEVANWQLRDTYESVVGKKPSREWSWDRTARELFAEYDRSRLSVVERDFDKGLAAQRAGKLDDMAALFDDVLSQSPVFGRASEMAPGYAAYAAAHLDDAPDLATRALLRVERLSDDDGQKKRAQSMRLVLRAEDLMKRHVADQSLVRNALDLDPANARARRLLDRMSRGEADPNARARRYEAAGVIGALALGAIAVILLRRPKTQRDAGPSPDDETTQAPHSATNPSNPAPHSAPNPSNPAPHSDAPNPSNPAPHSATNPSNPAPHSDAPNPSNPPPHSDATNPSNPPPHSDATNPSNPAPRSDAANPSNPAPRSDAANPSNPAPHSDAANPSNPAPHSDAASSLSPATESASTPPEADSTTDGDATHPKPPNDA